MIIDLLVVYLALLAVVAVVAVIAFIFTIVFWKGGFWSVLAALISH